MGGQCGFDANIETGRQNVIVRTNLFEICRFAESDLDFIRNPVAIAPGSDNHANRIEFSKR